MYGCLGGPIGAPMVTDDRYLRFGHRQGGEDKKMLNLRILGSGVGFLHMKIVAK